MAKKQKKQYAPWVIAVVVVCLLIELVGMIPGIPFNGWTDVLNWFGMPQTAIAPEGELNVHFIDLGNADCILVRQGEHNMLIDAGDLGDEQEILEYLHRYGVEDFDLVIATHPHADHIGEMAAVLENFPVKRFVMSFMPEGKEPTSRAYLNMLEVLDEKDILLEVIALYSQAADYTAIIPISAKTGDGVEELLKVCQNYAVESPFLFPEDSTTDQPERQVMAEIIREKLLWTLEREVPHGTAVEITKFSERDNGIIDIDATIYCEKASHKGIIIGKQGAMLKKISSMARADCEKFMGTRVYLTTWVKVKENWRDSDFLVRNFGYRE